MVNNLAARHRPAVAMSYVIKITDNSINSVGEMLIGTDGSITIYKDMASGSFTASGAAGFNSTSVTYLT